MKEDVIYAWLVRQWPMATLERIENSANTGTPDINGCCDGIEFWIESKVLSTTGTFVCQPTQLPWHLRRRAKGGRAFVIAANDKRLQVCYARQNGLEAEWFCCLDLLRPIRSRDWYRILRIVLNNGVQPISLGV